MKLIGQPVHASRESLAPDWIEQHNARVKAFRDSLAPVLEGMTDDQCREVVAMAKVEGLSMDRIAERMREPLGGKWTVENVAAGTALYRTALVRLDEYDDDFRPRPSRSFMGTARGGAEIHYLAAEGQYEVVAGSHAERFKAAFVPRFGMDIDDIARAEDIALKLVSA